LGDKNEGNMVNMGDEICFAVGGCTFINEWMNWNKMECVNKGECNKIAGWSGQRISGINRLIMDI
jgi:hypothetical protein